jgi:hypothetical protein
MLIFKRLHRSSLIAIGSISSNWKLPSHTFQPFLGSSPSTPFPSRAISLILPLPPHVYPQCDSTRIGRYMKFFFQVFYEHRFIT